MAKQKRTAEEQLAVLRFAESQASEDDLAGAIEAGLRSRFSIVVEAAARLLIERQQAIPEQLLLDAYQRFVANGADIDKNCRAKAPLVEALTFVQFDDPDFYMEGMKYVQMEPVWGKSIDTAAHVRGACAYGLIRCRTASPVQTTIALVDLLHDDESLARTHAASAISATGSTCAIPLLRSKVLSGDSHSEVIGDCFRGLLENDLNGQMAFVAGFLSGHPDLAIEAATALGAARSEAAVHTVIAACEDASADVLEAFHISLGLSRHDVAISYLLQQVESDGAAAVSALKALAPTRFYPEILRRVEAAVVTCGPVVQDCFHEHFVEL